MIGDAVSNAIRDVTVEAILGDIQRSTNKPLGEWEFPFEGGGEVGVPGKKFTGLTGPERLVIGIGLEVERVV